MRSRIQNEIDRVVGGGGVTATEVADSIRSSGLVRVEMAEAIYEISTRQLERLLQSLPDRAGVEALRQSLEQHDARSV